MKTKFTAIKFGLLILTMSVFSFQVSTAQTSKKSEQTKTRILLIFDASGSMVARYENEDRMTVAKRMFEKMVDSLAGFDNVELALRVFGHQSDLSKKDCEDTKLEVPFAPNNYEFIKKKVRDLRPRGYTPIAKSLLAAAEDFPVLGKEKVRNLIILITDGKEECGGDPCVISQELQRKGIILRPFIIGIGSDPDEFRKYFECVGQYYDANTSSQFETVLGVVISHAVNATSCQINLLDANQLPMETNVNMTIYDAESGTEIYNYIHTLNAFGVPDTLFFDPLRKYNIRVHTLPNVEVKNVSLITGKHNIIPINASQGDIKLIIPGKKGTGYGRVQAIVRKTGTMETVYAQDGNTTKRYLTGTYDIEILTTPRILLTNVKVKQDNVANIEIPQPGTLDLSIMKNYKAGIFRIHNNQTEWVADINDFRSRQEIIMQPGKYFIIGRQTSETQTIYTFEKEFIILSGRITEITL
jgi:Ca-activated chloride channel homolog